MNDPKHPIWKLLRLVVLSLLVFGCLSMFAEHLDITEFKSAVGIIIGMAVREFGGSAISMLKHSEDERSD